MARSIKIITFIESIKIWRGKTTSLIDLYNPTASIIMHGQERPYKRFARNYRQKNDTN